MHARRPTFTFFYYYNAMQIHTYSYMFNGKAIFYAYFYILLQNYTFMQTCRPTLENLHLLISYFTLMHTEIS